IARACAHQRATRPSNSARSTRTSSTPCSRSTPSACWPRRVSFASRRVSRRTTARACSSSAAPCSRRRGTRLRPQTGSRGRGRGSSCSCRWGSTIARRNARVPPRWRRCRARRTRARWVEEGWRKG
ncbi:hypothetical protein EMIHUDRAFT_453733, partial [Emiliania huxleyi CCMP1516]|uniref:Uncharacterized protein n=2 Tax=Emiliania huxleyi TaxID=2903 RepID=A0A0D3I149_EMIH1